MDKHALLTVVCLTLWTATSRAEEPARTPTPTNAAAVPAPVPAAVTAPAAVAPAAAAPRAPIAMSSPDARHQHAANREIHGTNFVSRVFQRSVAVAICAQ